MATRSWSTPIPTAAAGCLNWKSTADALEQDFAALLDAEAYRGTLAE